MSNDIAITSQPGATVGTAAAIFSPEGMDRLVRFATLMADSKATVPAHLAGKPADCLAVTMQAAQWGMNPFAVAQKTHVVNGTLGYEAQLVNAVVSSSNLLATRLNYRWDGDWSKVNGKSDKSPSLTVTVWATLKGESEPRELTISMAQAGVRNSPLWEQDPRQQLAYLCVKRWARLNAPDVLLGVYTPDELQETAPRVERDITPTPATASGMNKLINSKPEQHQEEKPKSSDDRDPDEMLMSFTDAAGKAESVEKLDLIFNGGVWPDGKKRPGAKDALSGKWLEMAEDVYNVRRNELNEVPMYHHRGAAAPHLQPREVFMKGAFGKKELLAVVPLSWSTIDRLEQAGEFPSRFWITDRRCAWDQSEVEAWLDKRKAASPATFTGKKPPVDRRVYRPVSAAA